MCKLTYRYMLLGQWITNSDTNKCVFYDLDIYLLFVYLFVYFYSFDGCMLKLFQIGSWIGYWQNLKIAVTTLKLLRNLFMIHYKNSLNRNRK